MGRQEEEGILGVSTSTYIYMHTRTQTQTHAHAHARAHTHAHVHTHAPHAHRHMHTDARAHTRRSISINRRTCPPIASVKSSKLHVAAQRTASPAATTGAAQPRPAGWHHLERFTEAKRREVLPRVRVVRMNIVRCAALRTVPPVLREIHKVAALLHTLQPAQSSTRYSAHSRHSE